MGKNLKRGALKDVVPNGIIDLIKNGRQDYR